jgi:serine phosphatase RsbU (regulator of sigma subunit)
MEEDYDRLEKEERRLQKEMRDAARVASALMPENVPQWPGFEITGFHRSMSEASGDWYFFERSQSGRFAHFVLCDISGHGVQAALVVSGCKTILSMIRMSDSDVFDSDNFLMFYAEKVNKILFNHGRGGHTATLLGITYDFQTEKLYHLNCGHPFPIIHSMRGDKIEPLMVTPGDPVGFNEMLSAKVKVRTLKVGESLIAHSDGVPLTRSKTILKKYFKECEHTSLISARRLQEAIIKNCRKEHLEVPEDDASLVIMRRTA